MGNKKLSTNKIIIKNYYVDSHKCNEDTSTKKIFFSIFDLEVKITDNNDNVCRCLRTEFEI